MQADTEYERFHLQNLGHQTKEVYYDRFTIWW